MRKTGARSFGGDPAYISGVNWIHNSGGHSVPLDQFGIGVAVLIAPFFAIGHVVAIATGESRNGFTWPYQAADNAAALVYILLGLALLASVLRRWFRPRTVLATILAITFGAAVFEHATYDASFSHGYSFFLIALVMRLTLSTWDRPRAANAVALGAALGLVGLVRLTNLVIVLFAALLGVERPADLRTRARHPPAPVRPARDRRRRVRGRDAAAAPLLAPDHRPLLRRPVREHRRTSRPAPPAPGRCPLQRAQGPLLLDTAARARGRRPAAPAPPRTCRCFSPRSPTSRRSRGSSRAGRSGGTAAPSACGH